MTNPQNNRTGGDSRGTRYSKLSYGETITILVGYEEQKFVVYTYMLYTQSSFFRGCLDGEFQEREKGIVKLPEDTPDVFQAIVDWLYGWGCFSREHNTIETLVRAYVLADKLMMPKCQNAIMDTIRHSYQRAPVNPEAILFVETCQLGTQSPLVQFFVKYHAYCMVRYPRLCLISETATLPLWNLEGISLATAVIEEMLKYIANHSVNRAKPESLFSDEANPAFEDECVYHVCDNEHQDCPKLKEIEDYS